MTIGHTSVISRFSDPIAEQIRADRAEAQYLEVEYVLDELQTRYTIPPEVVDQLRDEAESIFAMRLATGPPRHSLGFRILKTADPKMTDTL